jgi:peptidoglycan hydrolase-like protein with peptidoglycan-binding domain
MIKKAAAALLMAVLLVETAFGTALADTDDIIIKKGEQSDNVILLQMRLQDLGYYRYKITGFFGDLTKDALMDFQKNNNLSRDGVAGSQTLNLMYSNTAKRKPVVDVNPPPKPNNTPVKPKGKKGVLKDWSVVNKLWKKGTDCKVIDYNSGKAYIMRRVGGTNHADVAPKDKANNAIFEATYGKYYPSWYRRAVVVVINGTYIAASTNGYPHGSTGVPNNGMSQGNQLLQVCIHFLNSKGHESGVIDAAHQYELYRAAGKKPPMARTSLVYPND